MPIIAQTPAFVIRPYQPEDEVAYLDMLSDPRVNVHLPKRTVDENRQLFAASMQMPHEPFNRWSIIGADCEYLGMCMLRRFTDGDDGVLEVGYSIPLQQWGKGIATAVVAALSTYALGFPTIKKLVAVTTTGNISSQAVLLKTGFMNNGTIERGGEDLLFFQKSL